MMENRIRSIMVDILDIPEADILDGYGPENTTNWDSMNNLRLVTALEEEFQVRLSMDDIKRMVNFGQIKAVLAENIGR